MTPAEVPAELVEAALLTQVEPGSTIPPVEAGSALNYIRDDLRHALAAVLPLYGATVLDEARARLKTAYKTEVPRALLSDGQQSAWRIGISRAHGIVRDYQRSLTATTEEPTT